MKKYGEIKASLMDTKISIYIYQILSKYALYHANLARIDQTKNPT
jgi:hypothetical protein